MSEAHGPYQNVHVIINPASGQEEPILATLNKVFGEAGMDWDISITKPGSNILQMAQDIGRSGVDVVAVYGGDDTVTAAAAGLIGLGVPLAILPGGTANILSLDLGIPNRLDEAAALIAGDSTLRPLDLGRVGDLYFSNRVSTGLLATMVINADREAKGRFGELAYALRGLEAALGERENNVYTLIVDGLTVELEGVASFIANTGNLSLPGVSFSPNVRIDDGLLDVLVLRRVDVGTLVSIVASAANLDSIGEELPHWQGKEITVQADPPAPAAIDGEPLGETPVTATVEPSALNVIVPLGAEVQA